MIKVKDKWDGLLTWQKRVAGIMFFVFLTSTAVSSCWAGYTHFATNKRVDKIENMVLASDAERRIEWLEKQDVTCDEEKEEGGQSERRKINCKKWKKELDDKYKELEKLQT